MLYDAGAKEVHVKIACPEIRHPDFYGVDTPTKKELLAANKTNEEICEYIGAKSLSFYLLMDYIKQLVLIKEMTHILNLLIIILPVITPVKPIDELGR
jgi:amidophosphoribosyltransferase